MEIPNRDEERKMIVAIVNAEEIEFTEDEMLESARWMATKRHEEINKGKKANMWVCFPAKEDSHLFPGCKFAKCVECKGRISYDPGCKQNLKMFSKKVCVLCAIKNHSDEIDPRDIAFLKESLN